MGGNAQNTQKINREKVLASLNKIYPKCGATITPDLVNRLDFERIECPECGEKFHPEQRTSMTRQPEF